MEKFYKLLGIEPKKNDNIYIEACTHRSFVHENKDEKKNNERLEFLGDAILEEVVTTFLFHKFPDEQEGVLTAIRAAMVNKVNLSKIGNKLGIGEFLLLGRGEEMSGGRKKDALIANFMEAIIGALYEDKGHESSKQFIEKHIFPSLDKIMEDQLFKDPKSELQEIVQEELSITPHYEVIHDEGPDHEKTFTMGAYFDDKLIAVGTGNSKREGEDAAARKALKEKVWKED